MKKKQITDSIAYFKTFRVGDHIYPGMLIRNLYLDMSQAYELLDVLAEQGVLRKRYEILCPEESRTTGQMYDSLLELISADPITCPTCNIDIDVAKNNIQIYQVIHELEVQYE